MENQLVKVISDSGLDKTKAQVLLDNFSNYFEIAAEWENKAKALNVTDVTQVTEMKMAGEARKFLKQKRVDVEKTRKQLKEDSLREGQTIDAIAKILSNLIIPIEDDLEKKEKFREIKAAEERAALKIEREKEVQPYIEFIPFGIDLGGLTPDGYNSLLNGAKLQLQARIDAENKAIAEQAAREKAEREEQERIKLENEKLKSEAIERERQAKVERKKQAEILAKQQAEAAAKQKEIEEKARKEREESDRLLKAEQQKTAKIQADLKAKEDAEKAAKTEAERIENERINAEKRAAKTPDKEKLINLVNSLTFIIPELSTKEGIQISSLIYEKFEAFKAWSIIQINTL